MKVKDNLTLNFEVTSQRCHVKLVINLMFNNFCQLKYQKVLICLNTYQIKFQLYTNSIFYTNFEINFQQDLTYLDRAMTQQ